MAARPRLDATVPIPVAAPLRAVNAALLELLAGFSAEDWARPTVHLDRDVKDLTAHLLHGSLRRVTALRDGYQRPAPPLESFGEIVAFIQEDNRAFMAGMRRVSPAILRELIATYDPLLVDALEGLPPDGAGLGVAWAGEWVSRNWFDVAREYTEKWHHQQQLRDATGRPPLDRPELLGPVLETFARGLPHAFRALPPERPGASISVRTTGAVERSWTLRPEGAGWSLWRGIEDEAATALALPADVAWRVWTKGLAPAAARAAVELRGDERAAACLLGFVAIMA